MNNDANPMHPALRLQMSPRCTALAKRTGQLCQAPAVGGWTVCRMHGAGGGAPSGPGNGAWRHGGRSNEMKAVQRFSTALARMARNLCGDL
jgi:hypothetical protein